MVPPPRFHLTRYAGVLAPNAKLRAEVVPGRASEEVEARGDEGVDAAQGELFGGAGGAANDGENAELIGGAGGAANDGENADGENAELIGGAGGAANDGENAGEARATRHPWAWLLRRVFAVEVLVCVHCAGKLRLVEIATEPEATKRIAREERRRRGEPV
jgi:hypothetical protein